MRFTKLAAVAALVVLAATALLPTQPWASWEELTVGTTWPCSITGLSATGLFSDGATAGPSAATEQVDVEHVVCTLPARRRLQKVFLAGLVAVGSVAVIERYWRIDGDGGGGHTTGKQSSPSGMRMTKAATLIASFVLAGTALMPGPEWLGEFELLSPELACPVTVLSAAGTLPSSYDPRLNVLPHELDEVRQECIGPARTRLLTALLISAVGVQSVAVLEYNRNHRRRSWERDLQDQKDLFAATED